MKIEMHIRTKRVEKRTISRSGKRMNTYCSREASLSNSARNSGFNTFNATGEPYRSVIERNHDVILYYSVSDEFI